jgi:hypothetical protein
LRRARDLIATRPSVDPAIEDRLVAGAMARDDLTVVRERRSRHQRQWRVLVAAGSVAAAIAVIVGISSMNTDNSSQSKAASAPTTEGTNALKPARDAAGATTNTRPDLGDVTDAEALRAPAQRLLAGASATAADGSPQPTAKSVQPATPEQNDSATGAGAPTSFRAFKGACAAAGSHYSFSSPPALVATGTVSGQRVLILIYEGRGSPYADVIRVSDCTLVRSLPLR